MTNKEIKKEVKKLIKALEKHKAYMESIPDEVCDLLNDSDYYVAGVLGSLDDGLHDLNMCLENGWEDDEG
jgi:hypothetical protein